MKDLKAYMGLLIRRSEYDGFWLGTEWPFLLSIDALVAEHMAS